MPSSDFNVRMPASRLMKNATMHFTLTGLTIFRLRVWAGIQLLKLAALMMGCGIHVEMKDDDELRKHGWPPMAKPFPPPPPAPSKRAE